MDYVNVLKGSVKLHKFVTLMAHVIFVDCASLLITMPRGIKFVNV